MISGWFIIISMIIATLVKLGLSLTVSEFNHAVNVVGSVWPTELGHVTSIGL